MRAVLSQGKIGHDRPIAYASKTLEHAEVNHSATERELLAVVFDVNHSRPYLYGQRFIIVTDHRPLSWLHNLKDPVSWLARWKIKLGEYDYQIIHKAGKANVNADALSRNPVNFTESQEDNESNREPMEIMIERLFMISGAPSCHPSNGDAGEHGAALWDAGADEPRSRARDPTRNDEPNMTPGESTSGPKPLPQQAVRDVVTPGMASTSDSCLSEQAVRDVPEPRLPSTSDNNSSRAVRDGVGWLKRRSKLWRSFWK